MAEPRRYTSAEIEALTPETIQAIPDALLMGILRHQARSHQAMRPAQVALCAIAVAEARRRGPKRIWAWWVVQQLDPDRCLCGGPGLYIVGRETYCTLCRPRAVARLEHMTRTLKEPVAQRFQEIRDDRDARGRAREAAHHADRKMQKRMRSK